MISSMKIRLSSNLMGIFGRGDGSRNQKKMKGKGRRLKIK
jgi:hypothetical protein